MVRTGPEFLDGLPNGLRNRLTNIGSMTHAKDDLIYEGSCNAKFFGDLTMGFPGPQKKNSYFDGFHILHV